MGRVVHFELPADDLDRATAFYERVFGWSTNRWEGPEGAPPYVLVMTGESSPGIDGGIMNRQTPGQGPNVVVDVDSVDATAEAVTAAGGQIVVPRMAVPGIGWLIYFTDPEGNVMGAMESDESAA